MQVLDPDFRVLDETAPTSAMAVSADGSRIAWAEHDGSRWTVVDRDRDGAREERRTALPPGPQDARVRPVGFLPGDALLLGTTDPATNRESASVVGPDGSTTPLPGSLRVGSASEATGLFSVQTRFTGDGSCWQVRDAGAGGAEVWQTCDYSLLGFSPDGRHLLGFTDYLTPDGSPTMAVLDARPASGWSTSSWWAPAPAWSASTRRWRGKTTTPSWPRSWPATGSTSYASGSTARSSGSAARRSTCSRVRSRSSSPPPATRRAEEGHRRIRGLE